MKAIILAAGRGKRMGIYTSSSPKCLIKIKKKTLLERIITQLSQCGIKKITVIRGYKANKINYKNVQYVNNKNFLSTNMFYSLMLAKKYLNSSTLIVYADLIVSTKIIKKMIKIKKKFAIAVDTRWKKLWKLRYGRVNKDLESLKINKQGYISEIGFPTKNIKEMKARYIGIIKTSKQINKKIINIWKKDLVKFKDKPWGVSGNSIKKAYITDLIQNLIYKKNRCYAVKFKNGWYEFDNIQDYKKFNSLKI